MATQKGKKGSTRAKAKKSKSIQKVHEPVLSAEMIRKHVNDKATDSEIFYFLELCKAEKLNPFIKEAYLIKYSTEPATMVVAKDTFLKRAENHPMFDGMKDGIIILKKDKSLEYRTGCFYSKEIEEQLLGGWADVFRKDRSIPFHTEVRIAEYVGRKKDGTPNRQWKSKPATMINKVAIVQALRKAFPQNLSGIYDVAEFPEIKNGEYDHDDKSEIKNVTPEVDPADENIDDLLAKLNVEMNWNRKMFEKMLNEKFGVEDRSKLTQEQKAECIKILNEILKANGKGKK